MSEPWNLTPAEWSKVLTDGVTPAKVVQRVQEGHAILWAQTLLDNTRDSEAVLDLGCGHGENAVALALAGKKMTLLDWSQGNIDFCKEAFRLIGKEAEFVQADMTKPLPFPDGAFDTVFSCGVFEYFSDEQIKAILGEMSRISRKRIIMLVPNAYSILYRVGMAYMRLTKRWPWGGERPFRTFKPYFLAVSPEFKLSEFSVAAKLSLNFLTMPGGRTLQKIIRKLFDLKDHSRPSRFKQGYLLITIAEKPYA